VQVAVTVRTLCVQFRWDAHRVRRAHGALAVVRIAAPQ